MAVSSVGKANLSVPFSQGSISRGKWVGENRGGCAIESQERSREKKKKKKKKKSRKRDFRFLPTIREIRPIKRGGIYPPPLPRLPSLYWILRINKPRLRHEHADPNATRLQRGVSTQNREHPRLVLSKGIKNVSALKFQTFECFFERMSVTNRHSCESMWTMETLRISFFFFYIKIR